MTKFHYNNIIPTTIKYNNQVVNKVFYTDANGNNTEVWPLTPSETISTQLVAIADTSTSGQFEVTITFNTDGSIVLVSTSGQSNLSPTSENWATGGNSNVGNSYSISVSHAGIDGASIQGGHFGTFNTYQSLSSSVSYTMRSTAAGSAGAEYTTTIKNDSTNVTTTRIYQFVLEVIDSSSSGGGSGGSGGGTGGGGGGTTPGR